MLRLIIVLIMLSVLVFNVSQTFGQTTKKNSIAIDVTGFLDNSFAIEYSRKLNRSIGVGLKTGYRSYEITNDLLFNGQLTHDYYNGGSIRPNYVVNPNGTVTAIQNETNIDSRQLDYIENDFAAKYSIPVEFSFQTAFYFRDSPFSFYCGASPAVHLITGYDVDDTVMDLYRDGDVRYYRQIRKMEYKTIIEHQIEFFGGLKVQISDYFHLDFRTENETHPIKFLRSKNYGQKNYKLGSNYVRFLAQIGVNF